MKRTDLEELLQEQIGFLERSCESFDNGFLDEAKRIAVTVRVLLHHTSISHSLFDQLGYKDYMLIDTCPVLEPAGPDIIFQAGLAIPSLKGYVPRHELFSTIKPIWTVFDKWWNSPVIKTKDRTFSRRELVLLLSNKEGGAHVDPNLTTHYEELKNKGSGISITYGSEDPKPMTKEEHACLRQIAHELLESLVAIQNKSAPIDDHDNRPIVFKFPVYLFIKADSNTPLNAVKVATIESLNNLLPVFDNRSAVENAKNALVGDYDIKNFGSKGFIEFLKQVIVPRGISFLTLNPDLTSEEFRTIHRFSVTETINSLEMGYTDEEIENMIIDKKVRKA